MSKNRSMIVLILLPAALSGCIGASQNAATTQPVTLTKNLATTQPSYWYDQPATQTVAADDFQKLWNACEAVARDRFFDIERQDYRDGVLSTAPLVSAQWFEPWRRDARGLYQAEESSIATMRRSIRFEFSRTAQGGWEVAPKVIVEREAISEKRITDLNRFKTVFVAPLANRHAPGGSAESDLGISLPERYWYPVRRDALYEQAIASAVQQRLNHL